jgi:hypothetical protein
MHGLSVAGYASGAVTQSPRGTNLGVIHATCSVFVGRGVDGAEHYGRQTVILPATLTSRETVSAIAAILCVPSIFTE